MRLLRFLLLIAGLLLLLQPTEPAAQMTPAIWKNSCLAPWGATVEGGAGVTAYSATSVACGVNCSTVSETRTCSGGVLSGSFTNQSCTPAACANCTAASRTWLTNCTATVSAANHGNTGSASIADPGGCGTAWFGSATFSCSDGIFSYASGTCTQQTACDTTPNAFDFTPNVTGANLSTLTTAANTVTITGINTSTPVSVSGTGAQISINGGTWGTAGNITNGQTLRVRLTSSAFFSTAITATVNVGGVTDTWSVTTRAAANCTVASGATWVVSGKTCTAPSALSVNHGASGSRTDATAPTTGSATWSCTDGTETITASTCVQSCAANQAVAWSNCDALSGALLANGANRTVTNTTSGYTGTRVITCNNGTLAQSGGSCTATPANLTFLQAAPGTGSGTSIAVNGINIGAASATRRLIIGIGYSNNYTTLDLTGLTVNGVATTRVVRSPTTSDDFAEIRISQPIPSGTTANLAFTWNNTVLNWGYSVWSVTDLSSATAVDTATSIADPAILDSNFTAGSIGVGMTYTHTTGSNAATPTTWTGMTERYDSVVMQWRNLSVADFEATAAQSPRTVRGDYSGGAVRGAAAAVFK